MSYEHSAAQVSSTPRAKTRTWATVTTYTAHGEYWGTAHHTVTLTRNEHGNLTRLRRFNSSTVTAPA